MVKRSECDVWVYVCVEKYTSEVVEIGIGIELGVGLRVGSGGCYRWVLQVVLQVLLQVVLQWVIQVVLQWVIQWVLPAVDPKAHYPLPPLFQYYYRPQE